MKKILLISFFAGLFIFASPVNASVLDDLLGSGFYNTTSVDIADRNNFLDVTSEVLQSRSVQLVVLVVIAVIWVLLEDFLVIGEKYERIN